ncbi:1,4-dihydroxy-2-naphthoyl-CoA thioesterase 1 [Quillaja saponaria]|uniref:1,4-dihydroxy-2-naphthoyl-CoA thioesterase 1 n=1 Tax=Quillaja saponaria TaxID=32244 RepID=A0AAD7VLX8_QUISA|nr:1,4-dihydroxy-2-naphthoyl-CoA thioesterase 1 [Quillaja saponaria]
MASNVVMEEANPSSAKTAALDAPLQAMGFKLEMILSLGRVTGRQPITHSAMGDLVHAEATPIIVGKKIQVWEVQLLNIDPANCEKIAMVSSTKLTLLY